MDLQTTAVCFQTKDDYLQIGGERLQNIGDGRGFAKQWQVFANHGNSMQSTSDWICSRLHTRGVSI